MTTENPYAAPQAPVADVPSLDPAPPLWNPNAAASWSLLFTPTFGAILHMKNWRAMGEPAKAATSKKWAIGSLIFFFLIVIVAVALPDSKALDRISRFASLALLLVWYFASGKAQNGIVIARFGKNYPRKGWLKPLLLALLAVIGFFVAAVIVGTIIGFLKRVA